MKALHFSIPEHGWLKITFGRPAGSHALDTSRVPSDSLRDWILALTHLLRGSAEQTVTFSLEPGFARCLLRRESGELHLQIRLDQTIEPEFEATYPLFVFARRFCFEIRRIQPHYSTGWLHVFPERDLAVLENLLEFN